MPDPTITTIGEARMTGQQLREARETLGLTQAQLAAVMGMSRPVTISAAENERAQLGAQSERLVRAYLAGYRPDDWPAV